MQHCNNASPSETRTAFEKVVKSLPKVVRIFLRIRLLRECIRLLRNCNRLISRVYQANKICVLALAERVLRQRRSCVTDNYGVGYGKE